MVEQLSWGEIRNRATKFSTDWKDAKYEKGDTQTFYNEFFKVFGRVRWHVGVYERQVKKLNDARGYIDFFAPKKLIIEQKSAGKDLEKAREQAEEYFLGLADAERPRYILTCDFQSFELFDLESNKHHSFRLSELDRHVELFAFVMDRKSIDFEDQDPVNREAAELVGVLHDHLEDAGLTEPDLSRYLVRLVFCMFADDTDVFRTNGIFHDWLENHTSEDGVFLGKKLASLFDVLDQKEDDRPKNLPAEFRKFPHINGQLFRGHTAEVYTDAKIRDALIQASQFDWRKVSPAIFGSLFEAIMNVQEQKESGAFYTSEKNILRVIGPLFMDGLWAEFDSIQRRRQHRRGYLQSFHLKLGKLNFFDPACGCGNFLIIAYREVRRLEIEVLKSLLEGREDELEKFGAGSLSRIDVNQFHGIEINQFASEIARAAMWMMDHILNMELSSAFGQYYARIPLRQSPNVVTGDALELDWADVLEPNKCSFIIGNPPFRGSRKQSKKQRAQVSRAAKRNAGEGTLDYVSAWFLKAAEYVSLTEKDADVRIGFVATNSITQGEQTAQLWPLLLQEHSLEIDGAHRTFEWSTKIEGEYFKARKQRFGIKDANVHVVIVYLAKSEFARRNRPLFSYPDLRGSAEMTEHAAISPHLVDASKLVDPNLTVSSSSSPQNGLPRLKVGTKLIDGGYYIFTHEEKEEFVRAEPDAEAFFHPFIGSKEHMNGQPRFLLNVASMSAREIRRMKTVKELLTKVREYRLGKLPKKGADSDNRETVGESSIGLAETPRKYHITVVPERSFLVVPETGSANRDYAPLGWYEPPYIPSNLVKVSLDCTPAHFALLSSAAHMAWLRYVGGRMKNDPRYSIGMVYNTFPLPEKDISVLTSFGNSIIAARNANPGMALEELYDRIAMPDNLRKAHLKNDAAVDRLYHTKAFKSERERVEHLLKLYAARAT